MINKEKFRGQEVVTAEGIVKAVYYNELKKPVTSQYSDDPLTHSIQIALEDGDRIGLGLVSKAKMEQGLRVKDADDNYHDLTAGAKVNIEIKDVVQNGKYTNYNSTPGRVLLLEVGQPKQAQNNASTGSTGGFQKRDDLPVRLGNAITAASNMASRAKGTPAFDKVMDKASEIISIVDDLRVQIKEEYPEMDDYSLGARLGQCVTVASQHYVKTPEDFATVVPEMFAAVCEAEKELRKPKQEESFDQTPDEEDYNQENEDPDNDYPF